MIVSLGMIQCQQLDGGSSITGKEATQQIAAAAFTGAAIGESSPEYPVGSSITCNNGTVRSVTEKPISSGIDTLSALILGSAIGLKETTYYSKADVNDCSNAVTFTYAQSVRSSAAVTQKNRLCSEENPSPISSVITSILACDIETKARIRITTGDDSSSSEEE
ncbi:TIGR04452 family lipoprotein [Leptospira sp. GIMC2001]|uniref:TIGR04452 family lipoprotein n=1 Tax=Leptospira sp. GIMC2001 TaxID=1513297 RepID=UPI00234B8D08|nr:TIGR04452 family lipoprotein [Leptospira sp. GIMC2001]WCL50856.1 TIGR04452 family lipoprotein [Leptospira sp. GIMC2001]